MGKSSGSDRGGMPVGDGTFKGKITNVRDLATIKDGAVYKEMKAGISRYHSVLGVREKNVKLAVLPPQYNGVHSTMGGASAGIYLNSLVYDKMSRSQLRARTKSAYESGWSTKTNKPIQHTITHELAHATWNSHLSSASARAATPEIRKLYTTWKKDRKKKGYGQYAKTNVNEFWAEVTTKAVHGTPDKYTRKVKSIIKKYKL